MNQLNALLVLLLATGVAASSRDVDNDDGLRSFNEPGDALAFNGTTLRSGRPNGDKLSSLTVGPRGPLVLTDTAYTEEVAQLVRERLPARIVHAKGAGALGEFVVTASGLAANHCRAALFSELGRATPVLVRFSHTTAEAGSADSPRNLRGMAVKFYTSEGNLDLLAISLPVFPIRDPINFASLVHSIQRNPRTNLPDADAFWDFAAALPESLHFNTMFFSDRGTPDGWRHMNAFPVNVFKLVNAAGRPHYARFHWVSAQGVKSLDAKRAQLLAALDPDYFVRDLQSSIERGHYPSWTLKYQVMSLEEAARAKFNVFDNTRTWPTREWPLHEIGRLTLRELARNHFAQVEQAAFSPANLVPGIEASPDKILQGRIFSYPDAQRYRLGANNQQLPVNRAYRCPLMTPTYCSGQHTYGQNCGGPDGQVPNYVPSIRFRNMATRQPEYLEEAPQEFSGPLARYDTSGDDNYSQPRELITRVLTPEARKRLAKTIGFSLRLVKDKAIVKRVLAHYRAIDGHFADQLELELAKPSLMKL